MNKICLNCKNKFYNYDSKVKFCSYGCYWNYRWNGKRLIMSICQQCKKVYQCFKSDNRKFCSKLCYSLFQKGKPILHKPHLIQAFLSKGKKPKNYEMFRQKSFEKQWKGGITSEHERIRKSKDYKSWRMLVFKQDYFACQKCGKQDKTIEAHHIKPFALYPELRLDPDNGITLCKECHDEEDCIINQHTNPELKPEYIKIARKRIGI